MAFGTPSFTGLVVPAAAQPITIAGPTAPRTITVPDANFTVARKDAAQSIAGVQSFTANVASTTSGTGTVVVTGGIGVSGQLTFPNDVGINLSNGNADWPLKYVSGLSGVFQRIWTGGFFGVVNSSDVVQFQVSGSGAATFSGSGTFGGAVRVGSYTVASAPSAATAGAGAVIYFTDSAVAPCLGFSNGTVWKRCDSATTTVI